LLAAFLVKATLLSTAQLTTVPDGGNKKASISERVGLTDITIHYDRPAVKGREGKIWGQLVPFGFTDLGFGTSKAAPWRAGANENTTIEFSTDVKLDGHDVPAGKYGFFIAVGKEESTLIFSKNSTSWGSFFYDPAEDFLRINVKQQVMDKNVEWLKYEFINQTEKNVTVALMWEKWMFPFTVEVDVDKVQLQSFRNELKNSKGFDWQPWAQAAEWCADHNTNLEEALTWAEYGINGAFVGDKKFRTLTAKARVLRQLKRLPEADAIMAEALPLGKMNEVHNYARQVLAAGRSEIAIQIFKNNYKKFPNTFTTNMGMMRAMNAAGNTKEALKYAKLGLAQAPDPGNKVAIEGMIEQLSKGELIK
jgi:tetratricopeptide (TPR) repeat protein